MRAWTEFVSRQEKTWAAVGDSNFATKRLLPSLHILSADRTGLTKKTVSDLDLEFFQQMTVEEPVFETNEEMHSNRRLRRNFSLRGSVNIESHAHPLRPEGQMEEGLRRICLLRYGDMEHPLFQNYRGTRRDARPRVPPAQPPSVTFQR